MGRTFKRDSKYNRSKDFKKADKTKNRRVSRQFSRTAYNSLEKESTDYSEYDDYSEDLNFEKFSKRNEKR